eukprot:2236345-Prymnesium_polylepis.1
MASTISGSRRWTESYVKVWMPSEAASGGGLAWRRVQLTIEMESMCEPPSGVRGREADLWVVRFVVPRAASGVGLASGRWPMLSPKA